MEVVFCLEEEIPIVVASILAEYMKKQENINIVPQFVGQNPCSYWFSKDSNRFKTIILQARP